MIASAKLISIDQSLEHSTQKVTIMRIKSLEHFKAKKAVGFSLLLILPIWAAVFSSAAFAGLINHPVFGLDTWEDSNGLSWSPPRRDSDGKILLVKLDEANKICSTTIIGNIARLPRRDKPIYYKRRGSLGSSFGCRELL